VHNYSPQGAINVITSEKEAMDRKYSGQ